MSLKSSEIHNCSWRISTVLESSLISSSSCQARFPLVIRPMKAIQEILLKIFFSSPELNGSIFLLDTHVVSDEEDTSLSSILHNRRIIFPWFNISPSSLLSMGTILGEEPAGSLLCGFALAFDRHAKSFASNFNAHSSSWTFGISIPLLFKFITKPIWSMRNSDPGVSIVSVHGPNSDLNSTFTMQVTGCNFQYGPNLGVPLDPSFWLWCFVFSWKSVFTTGHCIKLCEISSVFRHEILSHSQQHSEILHPYRIYSICLVVTAFQFVLRVAAIEDLGWPDRHNPKVLLSWSHLPRVRNLIAPS